MPLPSPNPDAIVVRFLSAGAGYSWTKDGVHFALVRTCNATERQVYELYEDGEPTGTTVVRRLQDPDWSVVALPGHVMTTHENPVKAVLEVS